MAVQYQNLSHSQWDCKYHIVFIPRRRRKVLLGKVRCQLGEIFRALARQKETQILEGHLMPDHVHMCIAIPPKYPMTSLLGFLKRKSAKEDLSLKLALDNFPRALLEGRRFSGTSRFSPSAASQLANFIAD